jgi:hypothetical protein
MSWTLAGQIALLAEGAIAALIDKKREDDIKWKEAGL